MLFLVNMLEDGALEREMPDLCALDPPVRSVEVRTDIADEDPGYQERLPKIDFYEFYGVNEGQKQWNRSRPSILEFKNFHRGMPAGVEIDCNSGAQALELAENYRQPDATVNQDSIMAIPLTPSVPERSIVPTFEREIEDLDDEQLEFLTSPELQPKRRCLAPTITISGIEIGANANVTINIGRFQTDD